ncbi:uncharacterized protein LOC130826463 [Amaranthus tricolor]|uniref:uncharacterized protein LOC130826463 n=1 Tax=Amaranthus tricolor TaxID=29722 RepID=UPI002590398B|nr:uncharacterized protein LOC130826463 [Amaranthus tricolor]
MSAEFIALASASSEAEWLRNLMFEIPLLPKPISPVAIHADCMTGLGRAYSQVYNGKSRHIALRHSLVQGLITNGVITFDYVNTKLNVAGSFTKAMTRDSIKQASNRDEQGSRPFKVLKIKSRRALGVVSVSRGYAFIRSENLPI